MNRILLSLLVLCCLLSACSKEQDEINGDSGKYSMGFIGTWEYEGHQVLPYDKQSVNTLSILTINKDGTFTFKGESMFLPEEADSKLRPRIIDDGGTWSFDDKRGVLSLTKKIVNFQGNTRNQNFYYTMVYPDNGMILSGSSVQRDWRWYFTKK